MNLNKFRIAALSREPSFLLRTVLWIIIPGMVIAFVIGLCRTGSSGKPIAEGGAEKVAINSRSECYKLLESVRQRQRLVESLISQVRGGEKDLVKKLAPDADVEEGRKYLRPDELQTYIDYSLKMMFFRRMDTEGLEPFAKAAAADPVSGFNCSMYGDLLRASGEYESAFAAYERGAADAETGADCRRRALSLCVRREWKSRLQNFYSKPEWREAVLDMDAGNEDRYMTVVAVGDWRGVLIEIGHNVWQRLRSPVWILMSVLTGTLWFLVIHVGAAIPVRLWWRGLLGFGFGLLSIPVTHLLN
ncbi:MAG TPA: hypothetical protein VHM91_07685, partial [Verrucomicrobiales bacterium]|nr:hypothetical protein [Verrucomicrobiales bacterium]